jgi:hypothetical protein
VSGASDHTSDIATIRCRFKGLGVRGKWRYFPSTVLPSADVPAYLVASPLPASYLVLADWLLGVGATRTPHHGGLPLLRINPVPACCHHYPGGPLGCGYRSLPRGHRPSPLLWRVGIHGCIFGAALCSLTLRPARLADRLMRPFLQVLQPIRCLLNCSKVLPAGVASTLANFLTYPLSIGIDSVGKIHVGISYFLRDQSLVRLASDGTVSTAAGTGLQGYADGAAIGAKFNYPSDVKVDSFGNLAWIPTLPSTPNQVWA